MTTDRIILETPRLMLAMWDEGDATLIRDLHSTVETTQYMSGGAPWSMEKCEERLRQWLQEHARDGVTKYKILSREDRRFIGRAGLSVFGEGGSEYEMGYAFHRREWGKGYATEMAGALADWFFEKGFAMHFIAFTHPENIASQRVLVKIGMREREPISINGVQATSFELTADMR